MATVTGYLASKMKEIFDKTIKSLAVDPDGNLIATYNDNTAANLGSVKGIKGDPGQVGPPGTTPAVLANVSLSNGGTLTPGEVSSSLRINTVDLSKNRWYGINHTGDLSTSVDGAHALYITLAGARLKCIFRKFAGDPTSTREANQYMHIWRPATDMIAPLITVANSSGSVGPIIYNNSTTDDPRTLTLLDMGPATF